MFCPYVEKRSDKSQAEKQADEKARASIPEELIGRAIGLTRETTREEISRRIKELNHRLGIFESRSRVHAHLQALIEGSGE